MWTPERERTKNRSQAIGNMLWAKNTPCPEGQYVNVWAEDVALAGAVNIEHVQLQTIVDRIVCLETGAIVLTADEPLGW